MSKGDNRGPHIDCWSDQPKQWARHIFLLWFSKGDETPDRADPHYYNPTTYTDINKGESIKIRGS